MKGALRVSTRNLERMNFPLVFFPPFSFYPPKLFWLSYLFLPFFSPSLYLLCAIFLVPCEIFFNFDVVLGPQRSFVRSFESKQPDFLPSRPSSSFFLDLPPTPSPLLFFPCRRNNSKEAVLKMRNYVLILVYRTFQEDCYFKFASSSFSRARTLLLVLLFCRYTIP